MRRVIAAAHVVTLGIVIAALAPGPSAARAAQGTATRPSVWPRPGPAILYAPAPVAPQLENTGVWRAPPILISGTSAYRSGEFLYQGFLFDDHGARSAPDPNDPRSPADLLSEPNGTYTYPTNPAYAGNAADLVEFRTRALRSATAFRLTLNTMHNPALVAFTLAIGGSPGVSEAFPDGANVRAPAKLFLTVHAHRGRMVANLVHAGTGAPVAGPAPAVSVDTYRRQIQVFVPHRDWNPGRRTVRLALGLGLWDAKRGRYLLPQRSATLTSPGGAGSDPAPAAFFDVGFRYHEPLPDPANPGLLANPSWWRDRVQGAALAAHDISGLFAEVDYAKLRAGVTDDRGVPRSGPMDRIFASHFEPAQGTNFADDCTVSTVRCLGPYQSQLEPYAVFIPRRAHPGTRYGLTLLLHASATNYNEFIGSRNASQFAQRGTGSIVLTPEARGPDGAYLSYAAADVFEAWADVARHYHLNPAWTDIAGYSLGGEGTFQIAEEWPDLFARAFSVSGNDQSATLPASQPNALASLRQVPVLMWNELADELVPAPEALSTAQALESLGYRVELDEFTPGDHLTFAIYDQYRPAARFLGTAHVHADHAHVTYTVQPTAAYPRLRYIPNHAYWLSDITPSTPNGFGTVDAFSRAFGIGDPIPSGPRYGGGTLSGGSLPFPLVYSRDYQTWGRVPRTSPSHLLHLTLTNIKRVALNPSAAKVQAGLIRIDSSGPARLALQRLKPGTLVLEHHHVIASVGPDGAAAVRVPRGATQFQLVLRPERAVRTGKAQSPRSPWTAFMRSAERT